MGNHTKHWKVCARDKLFGAGLTCHMLSQQKFWACHSPRGKIVPLRIAALLCSLWLVLP